MPTSTTAKKRSSAALDDRQHAKRQSPADFSLVQQQHQQQQQQQQPAPISRASLTYPAIGTTTSSANANANTDNASANASADANAISSGSTSSPTSERSSTILADDPDDSSRKKKRTNYACVRCRKRHIKCPGGNPCQKCKVASAACEYAEADKKVVISMKYLQRLQEEIAALKKQNANLRTREKTNNSRARHGSENVDPQSFTPLSVGEGANTATAANTNSIASGNSNNSSQKSNNASSTHGTSSIQSNHSTTNVKDNSNTKLASKDSKYLNEVVPPFVDRQRRLVCSKTGEKFYVGSSSMTLFGLEVESMIPDNVIRNNNGNGNGKHQQGSGSSSNGEMNSNEKLSTVLEREGNAYRIYLGKTETRPGISVKFTLPSYSYAMLLIDTFITYNDGCFYFFNEGIVKESLRRIYSHNLSSNNKTTADPEHPAQDSIIETINFCKLLLIFAIGEMYLGTANDTNGTKLNTPRLPGSGFFQQASELFTGLFASGAIDNVAREGGVEVMLLYAFYLQVADCTVASYFYFGIALRASLILGLHVDVEKDTLSRFELEHRRRLWWTVYMFERMLSSKAGLPLSLSDDSISTELPQDFDMSNPPKSCEHYIFPEAEYIKNCVTIVQINALILSSLYQKEPTTNILPVIAELINKLFGWKESLPEFLRPNFLCSNFRIPRLVANLMTEYFQGINLAVRPLLFYLTTKQIKLNKTSDVYIDLTKYSDSILTLLNASFQGSINTIRSLWALMPENMVALFGYMDREYLFTAAATLILFNVAFGVHDATEEHLDHALHMFTKMRNLGNNPAELRRAQLLKLMQTFNFNKRMEQLINKYDDNLEYERLLSINGGSGRSKRGLLLKNKGDSTNDNSNNDKNNNNNSNNSEVQKTFNKKLLNKEKRKQVNNNRFIYQKKRTNWNGTSASANPGSDVSIASPTSVSATSTTSFGSHNDSSNDSTIGFTENSIHDINDIISIHSINHPVSNTRNDGLLLNRGIGVDSSHHRKSPIPTSTISQATSSNSMSHHHNTHTSTGANLASGDVANSYSLTMPAAAPAPAPGTERATNAVSGRNHTFNTNHHQHQHQHQHQQQLGYENPNNLVFGTGMGTGNVAGGAALTEPGGIAGTTNHSSQTIFDALGKFDLSSATPFSGFMNNSLAIDNELWDEITNQPTWLNDVSEEFQHLMDNLN